MVDVLAVGVESGRAVEHVGAGGAMEVAKVAVAFEARAAASAGGHEGQYHLIAFLSQRYAGAGLDDGAGALVSQHYGDGDWCVAVHKVSVATADTGEPILTSTSPVLGSSRSTS